ncbi:MAG TPA: GTPase ObgE [Candidatus Kapabacteria bacterium]|nr:GTPase ObgE [Candidatus Kapabacteria bacterium]HPO63415.1 GTPase ObgE [Candidatus Kapabacteria bacterium]
MKFIDTAKIYIKSGKGGVGHISFRHEKFVPKGGPDGGNGGKGGSVIFVADKHLSTLLDFKYKMHYRAENGQNGGKSKRTGYDGKDLVVKVPCGTIIKDEENNEVLGDLVNNGDKVIAAKGGRGGKGNAEFATPTNRAPRYAQPGEEAIEKTILLELKSIADVGIVGFPNVGKSTFISVVSAAKPKIADYHFTTLIPNFGIVKISEGENYSVADIPGIIEGASDGKGLGLQFLRHIERTNTLLLMLDATSPHPKNDYKILQKELKKYSKDFVFKNTVVCFSKIDAIEKQQLSKFKRLKFEEKVFYISSINGDSISDLKYYLWEQIKSSK